MTLTFGEQDLANLNLATQSLEDARLTIEEGTETVKFNPDQTARSLSLLDILVFQDDRKLLGKFTPKELGFLKTNLSNDKQFSLLLEAVVYKSSMEPQFSTQEHESVIKILKEKYGYLSSFALERQINYIKTSKDLCKIYYLLTILNFAKTKTRLYEGSFQELFWRLMYTTETQGWINDKYSRHLLQDLYFYNELFCFGINFVFKDGKPVPVQQKRSLTKLLLTCVSTSMSSPLPGTFTDTLFHNCINLSFALGPEALLTKVEARLAEDTGVVDVERNCVCGGLRRLHKYLKFGKID